MTTPGSNAGSTPEPENAGSNSQGAGAPQQPQQPQGWGQQPQGWSQPQGQGQWGQQPQQGWSQSSTASNSTKQSIDWTVWFYGGLLLLTFLTSFLRVRSVTERTEGVGSIGFSLNWWGKAKVHGSGLGSWIEAYLPPEVTRSIGNTATEFVVLTVVVLALFGVATYFAFSSKMREAALLGTIAAGVQLLYVIYAAFAFDTLASIGLGFGWWVWLLIALAGLAISVMMLTKGKQGVEAQFNSARQGAQNRIEQQKAERAQKAQQAQQNEQAQQQNQGQWGQQPPQPQQQPQNPQQGWAQPLQNQGQWGQPQQQSQQSQQPQQGWAQPGQPGQPAQPQPQQNPQQGAGDTDAGSTGEDKQPK